MNTEKQNTILKITKITAIISLSFIFIVSLLLILNYVQIKSFAPIDKNSIEPLLKELAANPMNEALKQEIRTLDLLSRKAFFSSLWQLKTGGYILLGCFILLLISLQLYSKNKPNNYALQPTKTNYWDLKTNERKLLILGVITILISASTLFFLSKKYYGDYNFRHIAENSKLTNDNESKSSASADEKLSTSNGNSVVKNKIDTLQKGNSEQLNSKEINDFPDGKSIKSNYPGFRGPYGLGVSYHKNIPTEWDATSGKNILWKITPELTGFNSPIIWENNLFIAGADKLKKMVYCINIKNGKINWSKSVDNIEGSPAKAVKVTDDTGLSASTLTTDGKRVFALFATGDIICFDMKGERLWAKNLGIPENHYGHSSSLIFYQNLLLVQYDHSKSRSLIALSVHTGETKWNTARQGRMSWSSPILVTDKNPVQIVLSNDPYVAGYDVLSGKEIWKTEALSGEIGSSPAYCNGIVFAANAYAKLAAIQLGSPTVDLWENNDYLPDASSPVAWKDFLYIATADGDVACFNAKDGKLQWNHNFDNGFYASPIIAEEKIFLLDRTGVMHILKTGNKFELIAEPKIGEKSDCTPAFSNGHIFIRGKKNLYCIGK